MLYVLERDPDITIVGTVVDSDDSMVSRFTDGAVIPPAEAPVDLHIDVENEVDEYPDFFELQGIPIASKRLISALGTAGVDNVVSYPAPILEGGKRIDGYSVLHIIGRVAGLDAGKSEVTRLGKRIVRIKRLALTKKIPSDLKMFRLDEKQFVILVTDPVRDAIAGMRGVIVSEAEGWGDSRQY